MVKFLILAMARTGTTFLARSLGSHDRIKCYGEIFNKRFANVPSLDLNDPYDCENCKNSYELYCRKQFWRRFNRVFFKKSVLTEYLNQLYEQKQGVDAIGFKLLYDQEKKYPSIKRWFKNNNIKIIHNARSNLLKILVSKKILEVTRVYHTRTPLAINQIALNPKTIKLAMRKMEEEITKYRLWCQDFEHLEIEHEKVVFNRQEQLLKVLNFLELPFRNLFCDLVPTNPYSLRETILNYDDVSRALQGTAYEKYLE